LPDRGRTVSVFSFLKRMIISPAKKDFFTIGNVLGKFILGLSFFMLIPLAAAALFGEYDAFFDFLIGFLFSASAGLSLLIFCPWQEEAAWAHSFFIVSLGWLAASLLGAVPLFFSHHWASFIDAWFEAMSGFATTGLSLARDLDHLSFSHNIWRHLMMFLGGQGIILAAISLFTKARGGSLGLYLGEGRQEKIFPNIIATARFIWKVSLVYLVLGTVIFFLILFSKGLAINKAVVQAFCLFMAAFDTGGFAPQAQSIAYYHSSLMEWATMVFMILGAINFNLHFWVWYKNRTELYKNFEVRIFFLSMLSLSLLLFFSLRSFSSFTVFRKGFYQLISAHTGCGFTNLSFLELNGFKPVSLILIMIAMALGGGICSTTGGIKLIRLGFVFKGFLGEIKKSVMPVNSVYKETFHHLQDTVIKEKYIKEAFLMIGFYLISFFLGGMIGLFYGYEPVPAFFESVSATANVGLSLGLTGPAMPQGLKLTYILQMWAGRLEFLSIFIVIGYLASLFKK